MPVSSLSPLVRAFLAAIAAVFVVLCVRVSPAAADAFGPQFPISSDLHPSENLQAGWPDIAYNSVTDQYLVVYVAATTPSEDDIYGQLLDSNGNRIGPEFRISVVSQGHENYNPPAVGYDSETGQYLVAWDREETVYVRLFAPNGAPLSGELPISAEQEDIETEAIAYSPVTHEYLVVWKAFPDGLVYAQRLSQSAAEVGADDAVVGGNEELTVDDAVDVAYNATNLEYLIVFLARPDSLNDEEVYGQRLALNGAEIGTDDFKISDMGPPLNSEFQAAPPSVAWNSVLNQYLVGWHGEDDASPLDPEEREVYGQLLAADGTQIGPDDFRISDMGPDGDNEYEGFRPRIAFDRYSNQYLLAWHGGELGLGEDEYEIWGQYLAADGTQIGNNDFRISEVLPDGSDEFGANRPAVAFNPKACGYLVTYFSGDPGSAADSDSAVLGRRVSAPPACPVPPPPTPLPIDRIPPVISGLRVAPKVISSGINVRNKKKRSAGASKVRKQAKARYRLSEAANVVLALERKVKGRKSGGKCRRVKGGKPKGRRCVLWIKTGRKLNQTAIAGANVKSFTAKSFRKRGLKPGAYRIAIVATDAAGNSATKASARFQVVQPK